MRRRLAAWLVGLAVVLPSVAAAQTGTVMPMPKAAFYDNDGNPCAGCKLYAYTAGTLTPLDTYSDVLLTTPNANPVVLDAAGRATVYLSATSYKFILKTSADATIWTQDSVPAVPSTVTGLSSTSDLTLQVDSNNDGSNKLSILNGTSVEKAQIDESGNLQVDGNVTIGDATEADKKILFDGNAQDYYIAEKDSTDALIIGRGATVGTTPALTIDSSGNTALAGVLTVSGAGTHSFAINANSSNSVAVTNANTGNATAVSFSLTAGSTVGDLTAWSQGVADSGYYGQSRVLLKSEGAGGLRLAATHASGVIAIYAGGTTVRGGYSAAGSAFVGATDPWAATSVGGLHVIVSHSTASNMILHTTADVGGGAFVGFANAATATQGSITATNSTTTAYNTSSDVRLKTDLGLANDLSGLRAVRIHDFIWTESGIPARGVFAQDTYLVFPAAITVGDDSLTPNGKLAKPWMADYSKFVPDLIVGWQDHESRLSADALELAALKARVAELEARIH